MLCSTTAQQALRGKQLLIEAGKLQTYIGRCKGLADLVQETGHNYHSGMLCNHSGRNAQQACVSKLHKTVQHIQQYPSAKQQAAAHHRTAQHSTAQHSTAQHRTATCERVS